MKFSLPVMSILTGLALSLAGCDTAETKPETPAKSEVTVPKPGPGAEAGPIMPAPEPHLPATTKYDPKADEAAKPAETKPDEKKVEPKVEPPK